MTMINCILIKCWCLCLLLIVGNTIGIEALGNMYLRQVHVITRHGSRAPLPKDATTLEEKTDKSILTPNGQRQLYDLGVWLRDRYFDKDIIRVFDNRKVRIESSDFDRTIVSANSLALGLFPLEARGSTDIPETPLIVPIYNEKNVNDVIIRSYDKCATFLERLHNLYKSDYWKDFEREHMQLLHKLGRIPEFSKYVIDADTGGHLPLEHVWNAYDLINVEKNECGDNTHRIEEICNSLPGNENLANQITAQEWTELQEIVRFSELAKYAMNSTAGNLLGSNILNQVLTRMIQDPTMLPVADAIGIDQTEQNKFFLTSGHFPTILGIFSALNQPFFPNQVIPSYASAIIFELYQDLDTYERFVQAVYKPGGSNIPEQLSFTGPCAGPNTIPEACPISKFQRLVDENILTTPEKWCRACENDSADICLRQGGIQPHQFNQVDMLHWGTCTDREFNITAGIGLGCGMIVGTTLTVLLIISYLRSSNTKKFLDLDNMDLDDTNNNGDGLGNNDSARDNNNETSLPIQERETLMRDLSEDSLSRSRPPPSSAFLPGFT